MSGPRKLQITFPSQIASGGSFFAIDPKQSAKWLEGLPLANIGETTHLVYKAMSELNRLAMPELTRIKIAEQFREPVRFLDQRLLVRYNEAAFPLSPKIRKIALLNRTLHQELATAYKIALVEQAQAGDARLDRKLLVVAGARALYFSTSVLLHSSLIYEPPPPGTWQEMHETFGLMQYHGLDRTPVRDTSPAHPSLAQVTPEGLYCSALLFALVPPFRMRQRDMLGLIQALPGWGADIPTTPLERARAGDTLCVVETSRDAAPTFRTLTPEDAHKPGLVMNTRPAVLVLRRLIEETASTEERKPGTPTLPKPVLRQIAQAWSLVPERKFARTRLNFDLELVVGLDDIHRLISSFATPPEERPLATAGDKGLLEGISELTAHVKPDPEYPPFELGIEDDDSVFARTGLGLSVADRLAGWLPPQEPPPEPRIHSEVPRTFRLRTLNESAGGYCLSWEGTEVPRVKVGELIGIQSTKAPEQVGIGVIRWMKHEEQTGHQLGIQMLATSPVAIELRAKGRDQDTPRKGLLLSRPQHLSESPCLLTAPLVFRPGDEISVVGSHPVSKLVLGRLVDSTGAFSRFLAEQPKADRTNDDPDRGRPDR
jgi:hypothetical protein